MKATVILSALLIGLSLVVGCTSTETEAEKEAYYEGGKMTDQVESWKKHGRY